MLFLLFFKGLVDKKLNFCIISITLNFGKVLVSMDRDVNGENRDSTDSELIDLYNELLDKLEKVSSEKKKL